jgi:predicted phage terminase large subunit-like protein
MRNCWQLQQASLSSDEWIEAFCSLVKKWEPMEWAEEQGQIKAGVGPFLERMQRERHAYVYRSEFPTRGDKTVRAQSIRGRMALDGLYVPQSAAWLSDLRHELLSFPAGKHDDIVDTLGLVGQLLDRTGSSRGAVMPQSRPRPPYSDLLRLGARGRLLGGSQRHDEARQQEHCRTESSWCLARSPCAMPRRPTPIPIISIAIA